MALALYATQTGPHLNPFPIISSFQFWKSNKSKTSAPQLAQNHEPIPLAQGPLTQPREVRVISTPPRSQAQPQPQPQIHNLSQPPPSYQHQPRSSRELSEEDQGGEEQQCPPAYARTQQHLSMPRVEPPPAYARVLKSSNPKKEDGESQQRNGKDNTESEYCCGCFWIGPTSRPDGFAPWMIF